MKFLPHVGSRRNLEKQLSDFEKEQPQLVKEEESDLTLAPQQRVGSGGLG